MMLTHQFTIELRLSLFKFLMIIAIMDAWHFVYMDFYFIITLIITLVSLIRIHHCACVYKLELNGMIRIVMRLTQQSFIRQECY